MGLSRQVLPACSVVYYEKICVNLSGFRRDFPPHRMDHTAHPRKLEVNFRARVLLFLSEISPILYM